MIELKIATRGMKISEAMRLAVSKRVESLESLYDRIEKCEVVIAAPHRHHSKGKIYHVSVRLDLPGTNLVVNREPEKNPAHEDFYAALADAFRAAERRLQDHVRKLRGFVKKHDHEGRPRDGEGESGDLSPG